MSENQPCPSRWHLLPPQPDGQASPAAVAEAQQELIATGIAMHEASLRRELAGEESHDPEVVNALLPAALCEACLRLAMLSMTSPLLWSRLRLQAPGAALETLNQLRAGIRSGAG